MRQDAELAGAQVGTQVVDSWFVADTGLPVRVEFDTQVATDTPLGPIDYRDTGSFQLDSLEPVG